MNSLSEHFSGIPLLEHCHPDDFEITELTSLTNRKNRLSNQTLDLVLRIPKARTNRDIDRSREINNLEIALLHGLTLERLWSNGEGVALSNWLVGGRTLEKDDLVDRKLLENLIERLAILHRSTPGFAGRVSIDDCLEQHHARLPRTVAARFQTRLGDLLQRYRLYKPMDTLWVNSHNDLNLANCLIDRSAQLWLIDWEFSGRSSVYWDLAMLARMCSTGQSLLAELVSIYMRHVEIPFKLSLELLSVYCEMLDLLDLMWGEVYEFN